MFRAKDTLDKVYDLAQTYLDGSCDVFKHEDLLSLGCDIVLPNALNHSHVSLMCSQPCLSPTYFINVPIDNPMICDGIVDLGYKDNMFDMLGGNINDYVSLGYFRGCDPSIEPFYVCLEDMLRKIMCTTFFNPSYDFLKVIHKV